MVESMKCFLSAGISLYIFSAFAVPVKFQVCTMTINSLEEERLFREYLPARHFEFVELTSDDLYDFSERQSGLWLERACSRQDLQCDVLIISGHFAGMFFGTENDHVLSVYELEKTACRRQCPRVFSQLKEAFLFGCNTMAHKHEIQRTPEEYLNDLLEYNLPQNEAETAVAGRYSNLGVTYKTRMEHIFSDRTKIYGFTEKSPLGSQVEPVLRNYLSSVQDEYGGYYNYLVHHFYKNAGVSFFNSHFHNSFSPISSVQQSYGMTENHPRYRAFQNICRLYSDQESSVSKMQVVRSLLEQGDGLAAFSAVRVFLVQERSSFSSEAFRIFNEVRGMEPARKMFLSAYQELNERLVYMKSLLLNFLSIMGWMERGQYQEELTRVLWPVLESPSLQSYDILGSLIHGDFLDYRDILADPSLFSSDYFQNIWSVLLVDFLKVKNDLGLEKRLMQYCLESLERGNEVICYQVLKTLGHLGAEDSAVLNQMMQFLSSEDEGLVYYALYGLAYSQVKSVQIQFEIVQQVYHSNFWIRLQAVQTLKYLGLVRREGELRRILEQVLRREAHPSVVEALREVLTSAQ